MQDRDTILLRDPRASEPTACRPVLEDAYECVSVASLDEARDVLSRRPVAAMVVRGVDSTAEGVDLCRALSRIHQDLKIILLAGEDHPRLVIDAFNENRLFRCLIEPVPPQELKRAVRDAVRRHEMDRIQNLLVQCATDIDRQIHGIPYWLHRLRMSCFGLTRLVAGSVTLCVMAGLLLLLAGIGVFLLLYYLKSAMGIDFFGDRHLKDCLIP